MLEKFLTCLIYRNVSVVISLTANLSQRVTSNWSWGNLNSIGSKKKVEHKWRLRNAKRSVGSAEDPIGEKGPKNKDSDKKKKITKNVRNADETDKDELASAKEQTKKKRTKNIRNADETGKDELASAKEQTSSESMGPIEEQQASGPIEEQQASAKKQTSREYMGPIEEQQAFVKEPDRNSSNEYRSNDNTDNDEDPYNDEKPYNEGSWEHLYKESLKLVKIKQNERKTREAREIAKAMEAKAWEAAKKRWEEEEEKLPLKDYAGFLTKIASLMMQFTQACRRHGQIKEAVIVVGIS
ncbi:hypothetical protein Cgig2_010623 [Carnegiea gigantea]|uniref:Uncharacterized protein n=1 Tax=Carnegiea gigantea TaxID=171969 RepID=A0A9Q1GWP0_9CARY|nr:hypothetical protein Cgig2_010623 [Carnegiea gigantea]